MTAALSVSGLGKTFGGERRFFGRSIAPTHAVRDVTFRVASGETLGIVGESGCGKTTLARMLVGLLKPSTGNIAVYGERPPADAVVNRGMQYVFQDSLGALNPRKTIRQIMEAPLRHLLGMDAPARNRRIAELFDAVSLRPQFLERYPHEFSGGQAQRIGIARALAANPRIIVLDEPTSALDVSVQAQVLNLLADLREEYELTYIFISHDLAVVEAISDRVAVLYRGSVVELADAAGLFSAAKHPYTRLLADSAPHISRPPAAADEHLAPDAFLHDDAIASAGCAFAPRCPRVGDDCRRIAPAPVFTADDNYFRCFHPVER